MTSSRDARRRPNLAFRRLRGTLSPGEFASVVRRAAREIGEQVSCDARYIGRVESGEIQCPNYAYERVFRHMYPGNSLEDLGFIPREMVRGKRFAGSREADPSWPGELAQARAMTGVDLPSEPGRGPLPDRQSPPSTVPLTQASFGPESVPGDPWPASPTRSSHPPGQSGQTIAGHPEDSAPHRPRDEPSCEEHLAPAAAYGSAAPVSRPPQVNGTPEEKNDVRRRAFVIGGSTVAATTLSFDVLGPGALNASASTPGRRVGLAQVHAVDELVRRIRVLDDQHGGDGLLAGAGQSLRSAYRLLDEGDYTSAVARRLTVGTGELAISVGWLAHDAQQREAARSHYAEALAAARLDGDPALEAHAFSNTSFLARDVGRPREAVRAAQAGQQIAKHLSSERLLSLLALREAAGWAGLLDRTACERALGRARDLYAKGPGEADPEWMSFFGEAEFAGLQAQCWSTLGDYRRAARRARLAVDRQKPHFVRNIALFTVELAGTLLGGGEITEAAYHAHRALDLLDQVRSSRINRMLERIEHQLRDQHQDSTVTDFMTAYRERHQAPTTGAAGAPPLRSRHPPSDAGLRDTGEPPAPWCPRGG